MFYKGLKSSSSLRVCPASPEPLACVTNTTDGSPEEEDPQTTPKKGSVQLPIPVDAEGSESTPQSPTPFAATSPPNPLLASEAPFVPPLTTSHLRLSADDLAKLHDPDSGVVASPEKVSAVAAPTKPQRPSPFATGDRVEARFGGKTKYYPGVVQKCNDEQTYCVAYDDGDLELHVALEMVRVFGHDAGMHLVLPGLWLGDLAASLDGASLAAAGITHVVDLANTIHADNSIHQGQERYVVLRDDKSGGCDWAASCPSVVARLFVRVDDVEDAPLAGHWAAINTFVDEALGYEAPAPASNATTHEAAVDAEIRAASQLRKAMMYCGGAHPLGLSGCSPRGNSVLIHCVRGKSRSAATTAHFLMASRGYSLRQAMRAVTQARPGVSINVGFKRKLQEREGELRPGQKPSVQLKVASRKEKIAGIIEKRRAAEAAELAATKGSPEKKGAASQAVGSEGSGGAETAAAEPLSLETLDKCAVDVLRKEAKRRGLVEKGTKRQLVQRLQTALKAEAAAAAAAEMGEANEEGVVESSEVTSGAAALNATGISASGATEASATAAEATSVATIVSSAEAATSDAAIPSKPGATNGTNATPSEEAAPAPSTIHGVDAAAAPVEAAIAVTPLAKVSSDPAAEGIEGTHVGVSIVVPEETSTAGTMLGEIADID